MAQFIGDLNNDGRITMADIPLCLMAQAGLFDDSVVVGNVTYRRGDADGDGSTTFNDMELILDHINGVKLIDGVIYGA